VGKSYEVTGAVMHGARSKTIATCADKELATQVEKILSGVVLTTLIALKRKLATCILEILSNITQTLMFK